MENKFKLGDIVSLQTHPYNHNHTSIIISGDHLTIPPLMVVIEILSKNETRSDSGRIQYDNQYRCIWYSHKSSKFEESWIKEDSLKLIRSEVTNPENNYRQIRNSRLVVLKTHNIELSKRKASTTFDGNSPEGEPNTAINPLLTFISPVMQIIEEKQPKSSVSTNKNIEKTATSILLKCKWYNPLSDKISDTELPIEALEQISDKDEDLINYLESVINQKKYVKVKIREQSTVARPISIISRSGLYYLHYYDYVLNRVTEILLQQLADIVVLSNYYTEFAPDFEKLGNIDQSNIHNNIRELLGDAITNKSLIRIKYKDINEKLTIRTISPTKMIEETDNKYYLTGYCYLRSEERTFRVENIQHVQLLII